MLKNKDAKSKTIKLALKAQGVNLFRKATDQSDAWGMYHLGECLEHAEGMKKDFDAAFLWFCKAVVASPGDEFLYQSVQDHVFEPNLKEYRENLLKEALNQGNRGEPGLTICVSEQPEAEGEQGNAVPR